jgi:hypothetical protein
LPESLARYPLDRVSPNRTANEFFADHETKPRCPFFSSSLAAVMEQKMFAAQCFPEAEYSAILVCPKQTAGTRKRAGGKVHCPTGKEDGY